MGFAGSAPRSAEGDGILCWAQDVGGRIGDVTLADREGYEGPAQGL